MKSESEKKMGQAEARRRARAQGTWAGKRKEDTEVVSGKKEAK